MKEVCATESLYLDHAASSPLLPAALEAMWPWMVKNFANPSSPHDAGRDAREALCHARGQIAAILGVNADEIVFTSSGTEANNLAVKGLALSMINANPQAPRRIITTPLEHASVRGACQYLARWHNFTIEEVKIDHHGMIVLDDLERLLQFPTALCSLLWGHNEIGTVQRMQDIADIIERTHTPLHVDAVQVLPWVPVDLGTMPAAAMSFSGHKLGAGKGVGGLFLRRGRAIEPLIHGGLQEEGRRAGTENVPQIMALAAALTHVHHHHWGNTLAIAQRRDYFIHRVLSHCAQAKVTGHPRNRLPGHASFIFPGIHGSAVQQCLNACGLYCSSLAACGGHDANPLSLLALGITGDEAQSAIRISFDASCTYEQLAYAADSLVQAVSEVGRLLR